jgi:AcrR family transcriptional regulator
VAALPDTQRMLNRVSTTDSAAAGARRGRRPDLAPEIERKILLDAGLAVLRRNGCERATLDDVLAQSGLSTRAVYRHFRTVDELLCAVFRRDADQAVAKLVSRLAQADTPLNRLEAWVDEVLSFAYNPHRNQRLHLVGFRGFHSPGGGLQTEFERGRERSIAPLVEILEAGKADGTFPNAESELDARAIQAVITSLITGSGPVRRLLPTREDAFAYIMRLILPKLRLVG